MTFDEWFESEYPADPSGRRIKYQNSGVIELMRAAYEAQSVTSDDSGDAARVAELEDALKLALEFIDNVTITDGQWHWVEEARAAIKAQSGEAL